MGNWIHHPSVTMDAKTTKIVTVAIVAIIIVACLAVFLVKNDKNDDKKTSLGSGRLLVYGNADNDDYFDEADVELIQQIVDSGTWDSEKYPYADANNDGKVTQDDVTYMQNFLNGGKGKMYYIDHYGNTSYFNYPLGDRKIAVVGSSSGGYHGLIAGQMLGFYDQITAADSSLRTMDESIYPGVSKLDDIGNYNSGDIDTTVENIMTAGCSVALGGVYQGVYDAMHEVPGEYDYILLYTSAFIAAGGPDVVAKIMTMGVLLDCADEARNYVKYYDDINAQVEESVSELQNMSYVVCYNTNNAATTYIDTIGSNGSCAGDTWMVYSHLPMTDVADHTGGNYYQVDIETVLQWDPDVIFLVVSGNTAETAEEAQKVFSERAAYLSESRAYKNGMVFGSYFAVIGTAIGVSQLNLLASYIWPGSFDEDAGWQVLQDCMDNTLINHIDVKTSGYTYLFRLNA